MHRTLVKLAVVAVLPLLLPIPSAHAAWRGFGYPAQHTDSIGIRNDAGTAAFNIHCLPGNNLVEVQVIGGPTGKRASLTLSVDGKVVATHPGDVIAVNGTAMVEFGGANTDQDVTRWLDGIASATSDITISAGKTAAHFPLDGARSAAMTALSYCKFH